MVGVLGMTSSRLVRAASTSKQASHSVVLTTRQMQSFHNDGFLSVPSVSSPEEVRWLVALYDEMFEERLGYEEGHFFDFAGDELTGEMKMPQLLGPAAYRPEIRETMIWRNCEAMARQLLGPKAKFRFDHALSKPPGDGVATPWHQDQAFLLRGTKYQTISFWIPLQDVAPESGCLKYVPGSNKGPLYPHQPIGGNVRVHGLEALGVDDGVTVCYCPLTAGGAVLHDRLTLHGADSNVTATTRRAYAIAFGVRQQQSLVPHEYPWNSIKQTAGDQRLLSSPKRRVKRFIKRSLMRYGLLDR